MTIPDNGPQSTITFDMTTIVQAVNGTTVLTSAGAVTSGYLLPCLARPGLAGITGLATLTIT